MSTALIAAFLSPPLAPLLAALVGYALLNSRPGAGRALIVLGWGSLALLATPLVGAALLWLLETPGEDPLRYPADAIVVLGAGTYVNAPEYNGDTVTRRALERLRYAAQLHRNNGKPVLVSGGNPAGNTTAEATQMKAVLQDEWRIPVAWSEDTSANTLENARNSFAILNAAGIRRIYLVTHAWHMPRARFAFEHAGFTVVPAPTGFTTHKPDLQALLPNSEGLLRSSIFCREVLGLAWYWYHLKGG